MKYILQIGLETDLDIFDLENKLKEMFIPYIWSRTFTNSILVKQIQYDLIEDHTYDLKGVRNHSGGSFQIHDKRLPIIRIDQK